MFDTLLKRAALAKLRHGAVTIQSARNLNLSNSFLLKPNRNIGGRERKKKADSKSGANPRLMISLR
jgi:hypothetical protein